MFYYTLSRLIFDILKILIVVGFVVNFAAILTWMDRRQSAVLQDRVGPNRAGFTLFGRKIRLAGLLHPVADAVKLICKSDFIPPKADRFLHALAPMLAVFSPIVVLGVVPIMDTFEWNSVWADSSTVLSRYGSCAIAEPGCISGQIIDTNIGMLYIFAMSGLGVIGATIAGWGSDNKFSVLGAMRAASQLVSYEVTMGVAAIGLMMSYGSIRLDDMAHWQDENAWGIFVQPLAFLLFFAAITAESKRIPFDLPEGESEIVAGYMVEYSGMKFGMFYMGEYMEVGVTSALLVALFFGGYNLPFLHRDGLTFAFGSTTFASFAIPHIWIILLQILAFFTKVVVVAWFQLFVRWSLPRFRYDQLMQLGWKLLLPVSLGNILLTAVVVLSLQSTIGLHSQWIRYYYDASQYVVAASIILGILAIVFGARPRRRPLVTQPA